MGKHLRAFLPLTFLSFAILLSTQMQAQNDAAAATVSVPHLVQYSGAVANSPGTAVRIKFALYPAQTGGEPVWSESQQIAPDSKGRYTVLLGSATEGGLPQPVFSSAEAKWLGITVGDAAEGPRTILVATPYSLKASDAETLAGHPISDFKLTTNANGKPDAAVDITTVNAGTGITVTGNGTATVTVGLNTAYLQSLAAGFAVLSGGNTFTGAQKITGNTTITGNLAISGTINSAYLNSLAATLPTLTGANTFNGLQTLAPLGAAKSTSGFNSNALRLSASAFNSTASAPELINFQWQVEPTANNTASPSGTLHLLYGTATNPPAETGLAIASNGRLTFASGQTFPGVGAGTITGITTTSPLAGSGTSGSVALSLNTSALETTLNGVYGPLTASNTWSGNDTFTGSLEVDNPSGFEALSVVGNFRGVESTANGCCGALSSDFPNAVYAGVEGDGQAGIIGVGTGLRNSSPGVTWGVAGILQNAISETVSQEGVAFAGGTNAGVWADSVEETGQSTAILATADGNTAMMVVNNTTNPTAEVYNYTSNGGGTMFETYSPNVSSGSKHCSIDTSANLTCSGNIAQVVEGVGGKPTATYAMGSTENWLEDFGSGELHAGTGQVALDPAFAAAVNAGVEYHVFLTPKGDCKGLYIAAEGPDGFDVRELGRGGSSVAFDYRIVAKRKGYESVRMQDLTPQATATQARMEAVARRMEQTKGNLRGNVPPHTSQPTPAPRVQAPAATPASPAAHASLQHAETPATR